MKLDRIIIFFFSILSAKAPAKGAKIIPGIVDRLIIIPILVEDSFTEDEITPS
jgi:hypothetical protein